jgi:hypothetical protein
MTGDQLQCCYREQVAYAFYERFRLPKLYKYASSGNNWDLIPARCRSHPKETAYVHKYPPHDTALHRLLRHSTRCADETTRSYMQEWKRKAVGSILEANHSITSVKDAFGRTALHIVCMELYVTSGNDETVNSNSDTAIAMRIVDANRSVVQLADTMEWRTPLHYLMARHDCIPLALLSQLLEFAPQAVEMKDTTSETPLDIFRRREAEISNATSVRKVFASSQIEL